MRMTRYWLPPEDCVMACKVQPGSSSRVTPEGRSSPVVLLTTAVGLIKNVPAGTYAMPVPADAMQAVMAEVLSLVPVGSAAVAVTLVVPPATTMVFEAATPELVAVIVCRVGTEVEGA